MNSLFIRFSPQQWRVMEALCQYRFPTVDQMVWLGLSKNAKSLRDKTLFPLRHHDCIKSEKIGAFLPDVHYLTPQGWRMLAELMGDPISHQPTPKKQAFSALFAQHRFAQVDFHMALIKWATERGDMDVVLELQDFIRGPRPATELKPPTGAAIIPDGTFAVSLETGQTALFLVEIHRATQARTFRNHRQYMASFFSWCVKRGHLKTNPIDGIEKPKLPQRLPRCLTREETLKILSHAHWHPWRYQFEGVRNETILYTLVFTGLRLQELLDLQMTDINLISKELVVREGKGRKERLVPIHSRLVPILRNYLAERRNRQKQGSSLFVSVASNQTLSGKDVRSLCKKIAENSGVFFTPHMLRHTFGRLSVEGGLHLYKIKEIMGHSDISTTQGYLSVSTENIKRSFSSIDLL